MGSTLIRLTIIYVDRRSSELATPSSSYSRRSYSREPSVTVTITHNPGGSQQWRKSLSRDVSGDSMQSDTVSRSSSINAPSRSKSENSCDGDDEM